MAAGTLNNILRAPMLMMAGVESCILFSSIYVAGLGFYGDYRVLDIVAGPLVPRSIMVTGVVMTCMVATGLYRFHQRMRFREAVTRIAAAVTAGVVILAIAFYFLPGRRLPSEVALVAAAYSMLLLLVVRYYFVRTVDRNAFRKRTLVYGAGTRARSIADLRRKADRRGFQIVGRIAPLGDYVVDEKLVAPKNDQTIAEFAERTEADEIVVAMDDRRGNFPVRELLDARLKGIEVIDLMEFLERETGKIRVDLVSPGWLIFSSGFRSSRIRQLNKRFVDLMASGTLLIASFPVILLIALAIKLEDGLRAPVFYRQVRVGRSDEPFTVFKFRSMIENAEHDGKAVWAQCDDKRITRVGKFLRLSRLDELPQIMNVFQGQMSFVGPRPERPEFVDSLRQRVPYYSKRHTVPPGITGWAQLKYGYGASEEDAIEKLQFDLYYVKNHGLLLDLLIILQTVEVVLWGKGAR